MNTIISSVALATILSMPLAASAAQAAATPSAPATATVAMQQKAMTPVPKRDVDRQATDRNEMQSRQLGPTN